MEAQVERLKRALSFKLEDLEDGMINRDFVARQSPGRFLMFLCCLPRNRSTNRRRRLQSRRWDRWDPAP